MPEIPNVLLLVAVGLVIGSFLNVPCIYRLPRGQSVVTPASHCTRCGPHTEVVREPSRPGIRGTGRPMPNMRRAYVDDVPRG